MLIPTINTITSEPATVEFSTELFEKIIKAHDEANRIIRENAQTEVDSKFSDYEQSLLWQCMNDKLNEDLHYGLNSLIRKNLTTTVPVELYRGVNKRMKEQLLDAVVGDEIRFDRVTSFSTDFSIARNFSTAGIYGTRTLFSIRNCPIAFDYCSTMLKVLAGAPDEEFHNFKSDSMGKPNRASLTEMISDEKEWMLPPGTVLRIVDIREERETPLTLPVTVYHLEFITL